jgi:YihY family inner membrane protein
MSTANVVPETWELTGDDARRTLRETGIRTVLADGARRFRWADGFSHSRALAFQIVLSFVPAVLVAAGIAVLTDEDGVRRSILGTIQAIVPGPAGEVFQQAAEHGAEHADTVGGPAGFTAAALAMLVSAATAFGQIERGANRIYGVERDRPMLRKYGVAALMTCSAGLLLVVGFVLLAVGRELTDTLADSPWRLVWSIGRWPLGVLALIAGETIVFRVSPKRRQPGFTWLAFGAAIAAAANVLASLVLSKYLAESGEFDDVYGPVAGLLGVMIWAYLLSIGLFYGVATAAQLEAIRAGRAAPQSEEKVVDSEPASSDDPPPTDTTREWHAGGEDQSADDAGRTTAARGDEADGGSEPAESNASVLDEAPEVASHRA